MGVVQADCSQLARLPYSRRGRPRCQTWISTPCISCCALGSTPHACQRHAHQIPGCALQAEGYTFFRTIAPLVAKIDREAAAAVEAAFMAPTAAIADQARTAGSGHKPVCAPLPTTSRSVLTASDASTVAAHIPEISRGAFPLIPCRRSRPPCSRQWRHMASLPTTSASLALPPSATSERPAHAALVGSWGCMTKQCLKLNVIWCHLLSFATHRSASECSEELALVILSTQMMQCCSAHLYTRLLIRPVWARMLSLRHAWHFRTPTHSVSPGTPFLSPIAPILHSLH